MPSLITFTSERTAGTLPSTMNGWRGNYSLEKNDRTKPQSVQKVPGCTPTYVLVQVCEPLCHMDSADTNVYMQTHTSDCQGYWTAFG